MDEDYRNTPYCPKLGDINSKKEEVRAAVLKDHKYAKDMHTYISDNDLPYKAKFVEAYNGKCAYCGASLDIISWKQFEVDHFIYKKSSRFGGSKANAGYIENLVLSCYDCNRNKSDLELPDADHEKIHPDGDGIYESFVRDEDYYIRVSKEKSDDESVKMFYNQLQLGSQLRRLDYLLMNMYGLRNKMTDKPEIYMKLNETIEVLKKKRR